VCDVVVVEEVVALRRRLVREGDVGGDDALEDESEREVSLFSEPQM